MTRNVSISRAIAAVFLLSAGSITNAIPPSQPRVTQAVSQAVSTLGTNATTITPEMRLGDELTACLQLSVGPAQGPSIAFSIDLGEDGELISDPVLEVSSANEDASATQLERAKIAVENCLPLHLGESAVKRTRLMLVLDAGSIALLEKEALFQVPPLPDHEIAERALALDVTRARELQHRLTIAGFDPGGVDGVIGPRTRNAISEWQLSQNLAQTGFLNRNQWAMILSDTQDSFEQQARKKKRGTKRNARYVRGADGCVRYGKTRRIVPGQSFKCDARGMLESF